jgi:hypothetical protein
MRGPMSCWRESGPCCTSGVVLVSELGIGFQPNTRRCDDATAGFGGLRRESTIQFDSDLWGLKASHDAEAWLLGPFKRVTQYFCGKSGQNAGGVALCLPLGKVAASSPLWRGGPPPRPGLPGSSRGSSSIRQGRPADCTCTRQNA